MSRFTPVVPSNSSFSYVYGIKVVRKLCDLLAHCPKTIKTFYYSWRKQTWLFLVFRFRIGYNEIFFTRSLSMASASSLRGGSFYANNQVIENTPLSSSAPWRPKSYRAELPAAPSWTASVLHLSRQWEFIGPRVVVQSLMKYGLSPFVLRFMSLQCSGSSISQLTKRQIGDPPGVASPDPCCTVIRCKSLPEQLAYCVPTLPSKDKSKRSSAFTQSLGRKTTSSW